MGFLVTVYPVTFVTNPVTSVTTPVATAPSALS